jgi:4-aminobutyrate aminotransferase-like enzyme
VGEKAADVLPGALYKAIQTYGSKASYMILGSGEKSVRLRPPLTLSLEEADEGISIIRKVIHTMA